MVLYFLGLAVFDLAAEWMGWENVFHCEWNPFGQKILKHYWPNAKSYGDITKTDFTEWSGKVDIVSGGFPCQPYSTAGKRKGKADDRHLWPEMLRAIREVQPRWVVGENVPGLLNWQRGMVLDEIKADLETAGFEVFPSLVLPACGKNAPHRRDRLWIVAHRVSNGQQCPSKLQKVNDRGVQKRMEEGYEFNSLHGGGVSTNTAAGRFQGTQSENFRINGEAQGQRSEQASSAKGLDSPSGWIHFPTQSPIRGGDDGLSAKLANQCIEGLGNSIVPQVAYEIFKAIEQFENEMGESK